MLFDSPIPFREAVASAAARGLLPTSATSAELQALDGAIKRRATFSATVESVRVLQGLAAGVDAVLSGVATQKEVREQLLDLHLALGTQPGPGRPGGTGDVTSRARADLQVRTLTETAQGLGWHAQGLQADVLDAYPAQELTRFVTPRTRSRDWPARWAKAGGRFFGRRMVALKTDPIWARLGDPALFPDALGNPYPPFAFNSGMDVQDVDRAEAEALGLIDRATVPQGASLLASVGGDEANGPQVTQTWLRDAIQAGGLGRFDAAGVLRMIGGGA